MILFPETEREKRVGTRRVRVEAGDRCRNLTSGGGGYGDPAEREPSSVLEDVLDGYVTPEAARDTCKVALVDHKVDEDATNRLRN